MTEKFTPILFPAFLRECSMCGAAVANEKGHADWHERLRDIVTNGVPVVDPVDLDR